LDVPDDTSGFQPAEMWMQFWGDMMRHMPNMPTAGPSAAVSAPPGSEAFAEQMQKMFMDAWAKGLNEFMRSEAFLTAMKQTVDNALACRQQLNGLLRKAWHDAQGTNRTDAEDIMQFLHSFEDRVLDQLDVLTRRVDALEAKTGRGQASPSGKQKRGSKS